MCLCGFPLIWRPCRKGAPWREIQIGAGRLMRQERNERVHGREWAGHGTRDSGPRATAISGWNWPPEGRWGFSDPGVLRNSLWFNCNSQAENDRDKKHEKEGRWERRGGKKRRKSRQRLNASLYRRKRRRNERRARMHNNRFATMEGGERERENGSLSSTSKASAFLWVCPAFQLVESIPWPQTDDLLPTPIFSSFPNAFFFISQ